ncbi:hypothetical protein DL990_32600 [Amycolatopsis sp. WAC 01416]|uniref:hypothetical protein n=1 Tax=Amycolatopsis sp. WAC 01416 TaxID=2203196 RepID=UPI000F7709D9|nr:hypothetical protein [Amycolatopsis sp. WAC 01416]RSN26170.1 hypothetical protein DL990_32600 [Amycolatopsis sp. WAC 01416]
MGTKRGEPTPEEIEATRAWLGERGVEVETPARLIAVRVGARQTANTASKMILSACFGIVGLGLLIAFGVQEFLLDPDGETTYSRYAFVVFATTQLGSWVSSLYRERELGGLPAADRRPSALRVLGGWYLTTYVITFGGGAALAAAMYAGTTAQTFAENWLIALGWAALSTGTILAGSAFRRTRAEDVASIAVDSELRFQDSRLAEPAIFAVAILVDVVFTSRVPAEFTWWLVGYAALAVSATLVARRRSGDRPAFPPGDYGTPVRSDVDLPSETR